MQPLELQTATLLCMWRENVMFDFAIFLKKITIERDICLAPRDVGLLSEKRDGTYGNPNLSPPKLFAFPICF